MFGLCDGAPLESLCHCLCLDNDAPVSMMLVTTHLSNIGGCSTFVCFKLSDERVTTLWLFIVM